MIGREVRLGVQSAEAAVTALLGEHAAVVLGEAGVASWAELLAFVSEPALQSALARSPAGFAVLLAIRDRVSRQADLRAAVAVTRALIRWLGDRLGEGHPDTLAELGLLGVLAERSGRRDRALALLRQAWDGLLAAGAPERAAPVGRRLAELMMVEGDASGALEVIDAAWLALRTGPGAGAAGLQRAELLRRAGRRGDAGRAAEDAWAAHLSHAGERAASTPAIGLAVGRLLISLDRVAAAAPPLRVAVDRGRAVSWEGWAEAAFLLAQVLDAQGSADEALRTVEEALRRARAEGRITSAWLAVAARVVGARGRLEEAEALLFEAMELDRRVHGADSAPLAHRQALFGRLLLRQGRIEEAVGWLEAAVSVLRQSAPARDAEMKAAAEDLVTALVARQADARMEGDRDTVAWCDDGLRRLVPSLVPGDHPALAARAG